MSRLVKLDVVVPEVRQQLRRLRRSVFDRVGMFVLMLIDSFCDVSGQINVNDREGLLDRPIDVGLDNVSLGASVSRRRVCWRSAADIGLYSPAMCCVVLTCLSADLAMQSFRAHRAELRVGGVSRDMKGCTLLTEEGC